MQRKIDKVVDFVTNVVFLAGLGVGFVLGALHHYFGL